MRGSAARWVAAALVRVAESAPGLTLASPGSRRLARLLCDRLRSPALIIVDGGGLTTGRSVCRARPTALPCPRRSVGTLILDVSAQPWRGEARRTLLAEAGSVLVPGGVLCLLDRNCPRQRLRALVARVAVLPQCLQPGWRGVRDRLAYPAAREIQGAGFEVMALRLSPGELYQLVVARLRTAPTREPC